MGACPFGVFDGLILTLPEAIDMQMADSAHNSKINKNTLVLFSNTRCSFHGPKI
jgi:hypothetical protein